MNEKLFIPYQIAKQLKEVGFDEPCMAKWMLDIIGDTLPHFRTNYARETLWCTHNNNGEELQEYLWSAPMYQQVVDWFEAQHCLFLYAFRVDGRWHWKVEDESSCIELGTNSNGFATQYLALDEAIKKAIKLIKK